MSTAMKALNCIRTLIKLRKYIVLKLYIYKKFSLGDLDLSELFLVKPLTFYFFRF